MRKKILVIHGPNLNLLGQRETDVYGTASLESINKELRQEAGDLEVELESYQSNHEGALVDRIQEASGKVDFIIMNPAAYTHSSVALRDALQAVQIPFIEVHLSNIYGREEFRQNSLIAPVALGQICGLGSLGYKLALRAALEYLGRGKEAAGL